MLERVLEQLAEDERERGRAAPGERDRLERRVDLLDGAADVALRKWSLPVLVALEGPSRFSELRLRLPGVTPKALAIALKDLRAAGLVERRVEDAYPPTAFYATTAAGRRLRESLR